MNHLYLLRHGENHANLTKEFSYKRIDYPLNEKGVLQAQQTGEFLKTKKVDAIFSSPLKRAQQTAEIIGERLQLPMTVLENFRELNVGDLENRPPDEATWGVYRQVIGDWVNGASETSFPDGENYFNLWTRFHQGLQIVMERHPDQNILIVGHGGIFTMTMPDLCPGVDIQTLFKADIHNCALTEIIAHQTPEGIKGNLIQWSDAGHLYGKAAALVSGSPNKGELKDVS